MVQSASLFSHASKCRATSRPTGEHPSGRAPRQRVPAGRSSPPCCSVSWLIPSHRRCNGLACCVGMVRDHPGAEQIACPTPMIAPPRSSRTCSGRCTPVPGPEARAPQHAFRFKNKLCARFHHHQSVPQSVSLGHAAAPAASRPTSCWTTGLPARLRVDQSGHAARRQGPGPVAPQRRVHRGHGPRLQRLPAVRPVDRCRRLLRHPQ